MNQIMPVGDGVIIAIEQRLEYGKLDEIRTLWREKFPGVPVFLATEAQIIIRDGQPIIFEFTGDISPTFVAEFQRWWEEVNRE